MRFRWRLLSFLALLIGACRSEVHIHLQVRDVSGSPTSLAGVQVVLLPYDRDSLRQAVEAEASSPRPHTGELDSLFHLFRGPYQHLLTVSRIRESLRAALATNDTPLLRDSLAGIDRAHQAADAALQRTRQEVQPRIESLRVQQREWERAIEPRFDTLAAQLARNRRAIFDTTDAEGWVHLDLPPGSWWVVAWILNTSDPNTQWYWNLPATGDTIRLIESTGVLRPRYQ